MNGQDFYEKIGRFSDFFWNVGKCLVFIWDISRKMWKWRSWGNRKADTSGLISSFSPCRLDQRKEKYSFARHFQIVKNIFLLIKNIARAGNSEGYQVFLKTKKYCNFPRCPQKYFSNVPLTPDPRRWKYSPARYLTLPHLDKIFAPTTITSMIQHIAIHTVFQNTLDKNHFRIIFEIANCGSRFQRCPSFWCVWHTSWHPLSSPLQLCDVVWCLMFFMKACHHGNQCFIILPRLMIITWSYDDHLISENKIKNISLVLSSFDII